MIEKRSHCAIFTCQSCCDIWRRPSADSNAYFRLLAQLPKLHSLHLPNFVDNGLSPVPAISLVKTLRLAVPFQSAAMHRFNTLLESAHASLTVLHIHIVVLDQSLVHIIGALGQARIDIRVKLAEFHVEISGAWLDHLRHWSATLTDQLTALTWHQRDDQVCLLQPQQYRKLEQLFYRHSQGGAKCVDALQAILAPLEYTTLNLVLVPKQVSPTHPLCETAQKLGITLVSR